MNKFFSDLTKRNWGFAYHVILADAGQVAGILILTLFFGSNIFFSFPRIVFIVGLVLMAIGYIYEAKQSKQDWNAKSEFLEDMIANFSGVVLGSLKVWGAFSA